MGRITRRLVCITYYIPYFLLLQGSYHKTTLDSVLPDCAPPNPHPQKSATLSRNSPLPPPFIHFQHNFSLLARISWKSHWKDWWILPTSGESGGDLQYSYETARDASWRLRLVKWGNIIPHLSKEATTLTGYMNFKRMLSLLLRQTSLVSPSPPSPTSPQDLGIPPSWRYLVAAQVGLSWVPADNSDTCRTGRVRLDGSDSWVWRESTGDENGGRRRAGGRWTELT